MKRVFQFSNFIPQPTVSTSLFARRSALVHAPIHHEVVFFQCVMFKSSVLTIRYLAHLLQGRDSHLPGRVSHAFRVALGIISYYPLSKR